MTENTIEALTAELVKRDAMPIDAYEVAAVLESLGLTDTTARQRYGATSVFSLAETLFSKMRLGKPARMRPPHRPGAPARLSDWLMGVLLLIPSVLTILLIQHITSTSQMDTTAVLALCWGFSGGIFAANCCTLGITRRTSFLVGMRHMATARRFVLIAGGISVAGLVIIAIGVAALLAQFGSAVMLPFALGMAGMGAVWFMAGLLSILRKPFWLPIALAAGLATIFVIDIGYARLHPAMIFVSVGAGFAVTLSILLAAFWHATKPNPAHKEGALLPPPAYLATEALPFVVYGIAYAAFILLPHGLALISTFFTAQSIDALTSFEAGMTFALLPSVLGIGFLEVSQRAFWREVPIMQNKVAGWSPQKFSQWALRFYEWRAIRYVLVLGGICAISVVFFEWARTSGQLARWLNLTDVGATVFVFYISLAAFAALALSSFNGMFFLSLNHTAPMTAALLTGCGVALVLGAVFGLLGHLNLISVAFLAGALCMLYVSWREVQSLLEAADYYVSAAVV